MSHQSKHLYEFGLFRLDAGERLLLRDGESVPLTPKSFDLLLALVEHHGHLLEKDELMKQVWPDTFVEESNLSSNISLIRKALGDGENGHKFIETVAKRGYRFLAEVRKARPVSDVGERPPGQTARIVEGISAVVIKALDANARLAWIAAAVLLLGMLGFAWAYFTRQPMTEDVRVMKTSLLPPEKSSFVQIAVSPDGRYLAFTAATGGNVQLWVRALDSTEAKPLAGTQAAMLPFWSPDSRFIGFFADGRLNKVEATGGTVQKLYEMKGFSFGGVWSRSGVILFGRTGNGLLRISATGGEVTQVTTLDMSRQETGHFYPTFLPDGRHFLYSIQSGQKEMHGVYLGSLDGNLKRRLLDEVTVIKYMTAVPGDTTNGAGWLVFGRDDALLARPFDAIRLDFTGEPFTISDKVGRDVHANYYTTFSISDNGVLVFDPSLDRQRRQYLWKDRRSQQTSPLEAPAGISHPWLSPDGKRFIADRLYHQIRTSDLWLYDESGGNDVRFTFNPANDYSPVWSPDGSSIVWASNRAVVSNLYWKAASGAGEDTLLLKSDHAIIPTDWSRDGRFIIYRQMDPETSLDVCVLPEPGSGKEKPFPVVRTKANETMGTLSPDGRWLAYASDESGWYEVYVQNFPGGGGKRQVSKGGGNFPRWRGDGRELFYYTRDGKLMASAGAAQRKLRGGRGSLALRVPRREYYSPLCALCSNGRRAAVSAQRGGGCGAERAADGGNELGGREEAMMIQPGAKLGAYEILAPLGAGGMGEVYRARDTRLDRAAAIKVLLAAFAQDAERLRRFEQEARATSALNHPNILTVYDIGTHEGAPFIVAELLEGEELRAQLDGGALPVRKAIEYAQQITAGLAAAHENGIVHHDFKPENLYCHLLRTAIRWPSSGMARRARTLTSTSSRSAMNRCTA